MLLTLFILSTLNTSVESPIWQALINPINSKKRAVKPGVEAAPGADLMSHCLERQEPLAQLPWLPHSSPVTPGIFLTRCFKFLIILITPSGRSNAHFSYRQLKLRMIEYFAQSHTAAGFLIPGRLDPKALGCFHPVLKSPLCKIEH